MRGHLARGDGGRGLAAASAVALILLAGCSATATPDASASAGLPAGVTVQLVQLRSDVAARQAQVEVHNGTDHDLTIGAVAVRDPRFAAPAGRVLERESLVRAGGTVDIRVQLPAMDCGVSDSGAGSVRVDYSADAGSGSVRADVPIDDPLDFLGPLHERECRAEAVTDAAALSLASFTPSPAGQPAALVLEVKPTGRGAVRIVGIQTTNLLTFAAGPGSTADTFPLGVAVTATDAAPLEVRIPLVPLRCDPHAVQEDKRGTIFTVEVELDGAAGQIELAAPEDMRGAILSWVAAWCGFG